MLSYSKYVNTPKLVPFDASPKAFATSYPTVTLQLEHLG